MKGRALKSKTNRTEFLLSAFVLVGLSLLGCDQPAETQPATKDTKAKNTDRWAGEREALVKSLTKGRNRVSDKRVLAAMNATPRHEFVPERLRNFAYNDRPLSIGEGQTISQPYIVAFMTEQLHPEAGEKVLEIGTGSGYQAAVLSGLVKEVYSIEIIESLAKSARATLDRLGYKNVFTKWGDGYEGWEEHAPFDAIIVTCAPTDIPQPLIDQLREGGRMIIPVGPDGGYQELYLLEKKDGRVTEKAVLPVRFVPMTGKSSDGE